MKEKKNCLLFVLIIGTTLIIWGNSAVPPQLSAALSGGLTTWLKQTFHWSLTEHLIRKAGHFCEYALLGIEYVILFRKCQRQTWRQRTGSGQKIFNCASLGLTTAVIDESIQIFSGRGPMVADILLDFCGFGTGFIITELVLLVIWRNKS